MKKLFKNKIFICYISAIIIFYFKNSIIILNLNISFYQKKKKIFYIINILFNFLKN
jgi:hypothetical protein